MPRVGQDRRMRAVGITSGIGSMLVGARQAGFEVVGQTEWRRYYHYRDVEGRNTFLENFPGVFMKERSEDLSTEELTSMTGVELILSHPECGHYSVLGGSNRDRLIRLTDACDIPLFVDSVARFRPRFFVMDDLPRSLGAFSMHEYFRRLPDYDLYPEWVSNYHYGNVQEHRRRMFMLGALRSEDWVFRPGERENPLRVCDVVGDLPEPGSDPTVMNHDLHELTSPSGRFINIPEYGGRFTWEEHSRYIRDFPEGRNFPYMNRDGVQKVRIGSCKVRWEGTSCVIHGGNPILHPRRCLPLTIRERARIQGFPDDFVFYGTKLNDRGEWNHEKNLHMVKQTGKAMPVQFCQYVSEQVAAKIRGRSFVSSGERLLKPNQFVDEAKRWYCLHVGYSNQEGACSECWLREKCDIRIGKKFGSEKIPDTPTVVQVPEPCPVPTPAVIRSPRPSRSPQPAKPMVAVVRGDSPRGRRPGIGARMMELIGQGLSSQQVLDTCLGEFPTSKAGLTDVAKVRSKMRKDGLL